MEDGGCAPAPSAAPSAASSEEAPSMEIQKSEASLRNQSVMAVREGTKAVLDITKQLPLTQEGKTAEVKLGEMVGALNKNMDALVAFEGFWVPFKRQYVNELWEQVSHCVQLKQLEEIDVTPLVARCQVAETTIDSMVECLNSKISEFDENLPSFNKDHSAFAQSLLPLVRSPISAEQTTQMQENKDKLKAANAAQHNLQLQRAEYAKDLAKLASEYELLEALTSEAEGEVRDLTDLKRRSADFKARSDEREAQNGVSNRSSFGWWIWGKSNPSTEHQKKMADAMHDQAEANVLKAQRERKNLQEEKGRIQGEIDSLTVKFKECTRLCEAQKTDIATAQELVNQDQQVILDFNVKFGGKTPGEIVRLGAAIEELMNPEEDRASVQQNQHRVKPCIIQTLQARKASLIKLKQIWQALSSEDNRNDDPEEFTWNCSLLIQQAYEILFFALAADMNAEPEVGKMNEMTRDLGNLSLDIVVSGPKKARPKKKAIQA